MSQDDIIMSELCETIVRMGKTIDIKIFSDDKDGWLLEVVDQYGNSSVWDESFPTDMAAYNEVVEVIHTEGIDALIGPDR